MRVTTLVGLVGLIGMSSSALALDKVTFGTNWLADPEAGGYYQALVDGTYNKYGLDVTILPGGPMSNGGLLLIAGKIEFYMGGDMLGDFYSVEQNFPVITVAAHFQKDPQILMSHPGVGFDNWTDLPKATAIVSKGALTSFYAWMRAAWGFKDENVKPYNYNSATFICRQELDSGGLRDLRAVRGRATGRLQAERVPARGSRIFELRDDDRDAPGNRREEPRSRAALRRRVRPSAGITISTATTPRRTPRSRKTIPEMTDEQIAYSISKLKEYGIIDSGDTLTKGIGAMTDERVKDFFDKMVKAGLVKPTTDYKKAYTLQFVNKGVGLDLRPK